MTFFVRPLTPHDAPCLHDLHAMATDPFIRVWSEKEYADLLNQPFILGVGAVDFDGALKGFMLMQKAHDVWDILYMTTHPICQRQGLATMLFDAGKNAAKEGGAHRIMLDVCEKNEKARNFYEKLGFNLLHKRKKYYTLKNALFFDALILIYKLT